MDILAIPRLLVDLVFYLIQVLPDLLPVILALATPIALGALCGVMNERSGVVNIGIEGTMLTAAFTAYLTGFALHGTIGDEPSLVLGVFVGVLTGAVLGRRSMPGCRSPCGPTRSSPGRSSTSAPSASPAT